MLKDAQAFSSDICGGGMSLELRVKPFLHKATIQKKDYPVVHIYEKNAPSCAEPFGPLQWVAHSGAVYPALESMGRLLMESKVYNAIITQ